MKNYTLLVLCTLSQLVRAEPLELAGLLSTREQGALAVLTDKADGEVSPFLSEGKVWRGYRVTKIELSQEVVILAKGDVIMTLRVRGSRVQNADASAPGDMRVLIGTAKKVGDRVIYSPNAVLQLGPYKVAARTGKMESEGHWVIGDLTVEAANGAKLSAGSVGVNSGRVRISAKKVQLPSPAPQFESKQQKQ